MKNEDFRNEAEFENYFVKQVEKAGGICHKNNPKKMGRGIPDRLVSFEDTFGIVEVKNTHKTGRVTDEQTSRLKKFNDNGIKTFILDSVEDIPKVISEIKSYKTYCPKDNQERSNKQSHSKIDSTYLGGGMRSDALAIDKAMNDFFPNYFKDHEAESMDWQCALDLFDLGACGTPQIFMMQKYTKKLLEAGASFRLLKDKNGQYKLEIFKNALEELKRIK